MGEGVENGGVENGEGVGKHERSRVILPFLSVLKSRKNGGVGKK